MKFLSVATLLGFGFLSVVNARKLLIIRHGEKN
jgi:hypothetical protein